MPYRFITLQTGSVSAGATFEVSHTATEDYILHHILSVEKGAADTGKVPITIKFDEEVWTKETMPSEALGRYVDRSPKLDYAWKKDVKLTISGTNNTGAAIDIAYVCIVTPKA